MRTLSSRLRLDQCRFGWCRAAVAAFSLTVLWWLIEGTLGSWVVGAPVILAGVGLVGSLPGGDGSIRPLRLPSFAVWFLWQSIRSGTDVAIRALRPSLPIAPGVTHYVTSLASGRRVMLANMLTVLPGTLAMRIANDRIEIHVLDSRVPVDDDLGELERRIACVFRTPAPAKEAT